MLRDVNGDGAKDLVVAVESAGGVAVLNGLAGGQFAAPIVYGAGGGTSGVAAADFDGDGKLDIVAANFLSNGVAVLRGRGVAGFNSSVSFAGFPRAVASVVADFDGDGHPDIAVLMSPALAPVGATGSIQIIRSDGMGTLLAGGFGGIGQSAGSLAVADFNKDGKLDLVATSGFVGAAELLIGNGTGGVASSALLNNVSSTSTSSAVAAGDVNNDGNPDVVVANPTLGNVSLLLGNGNGTFQAPTSVASGGSVNYGLLLLDIDGDGKKDIVAANGAAGTVSVMRGNGNGTFQAAVSTSACAGTSRLADGEFNGDGRPDILVLCNSGVVSVLLGQVGGGLTLKTSFTPNAGTSSIAVGDIDGDGNLDIVAGNGANGSVTVARGIGDGTFQPAETFLAGAANVKSVAVADFNGDGLADIAAIVDDGNPATLYGRINLLLNRTPLPCDTGLAGDCDGDGIPNGVEVAEGRNPLVKDNDVFANARLFAMQQYRDFLGREGDAAGITGWSGAGGRAPTRARR